MSEVTKKWITHAMSRSS